MNSSCRWVDLFARPQAECFQCIISYPHKVGAFLPIPGFQKHLCDMESFFSLWLYHPDCAQSLQRPARRRRVTIGWYDWAQGCLTAGHAPRSLSWLTARQIACSPWLSVLPVMMGCPSSLDVGQWCLELNLVSRRTVCPPVIPLPHCPCNLKPFRSEKEGSQALEAAHNLMPNICAVISFKNKRGRHRQTCFCLHAVSSPNTVFSEQTLLVEREVKYSGDSLL